MELVRQSILDDVRHVLIEFRSDHLGACFQQRFGEGSRTRSDFNHQVARVESCRRQQSSDLVLVMEEVLTEPVLRSDASSFEYGSDFREGLHAYQVYRTVYSIVFRPSEGTFSRHSIVSESILVPFGALDVSFQVLQRNMDSRTITS